MLSSDPKDGKKEPQLEHPLNLGVYHSTNSYVQSPGNREPMICTYCVCYLNIFRGSDFFLLPRLAPPLPLPPRPRRRSDDFLKGAKPTFGLDGFDVVESTSWVPTTGAIRGKRYSGTCFMCAWILMGCNGLSCRRYSRSSGLSSKCAYTR